MKITITTWYDIEDEGVTTTYRVYTTNDDGLPLQTLFDMQAEKVGAIERKILK